MSLYKNQNLFSSGPHAFRVFGLSQRHQLVEKPGIDGAKVVALGRTARVIEQYGVLQADTVAGLLVLTNAVEAAMDGKPGDLIDDLARTWPRMVLVELNLARVRRIGVRHGVNYTAKYVQTLPELI